MANFNVNMDEVVKYTAKLEKLHRAAFPVAVRSTLNDVAFETKKLIPKEADKKFTIRRKTLFKKFSTVEKATGYDINRMLSRAGINTDKGGKIAEGLEKQETGGAIQGRKLIPHRRARIGASESRRLKSRYQFSKINIATPGERETGSKYILIKKGGRGTVFEIKKLTRGRRLLPVYTYRPTRTSRVSPRPYVSVAARQASLKMSQFYISNAEYQFKRALQ